MSADQMDKKLDSCHFVWLKEWGDGVLEGKNCLILPRKDLSAAEATQILRCFEHDFKMFELAVRCRQELDGGF